MEITLNSKNFEEVVLNSEKVVLVDFWATWCNPCCALAPVVKQVAEEYPQYTIGKLNVDDERELAISYGISSIPTLLIFKDGEIVNRSIGVVSKDAIVSMLQSAE